MNTCYPKNLEIGRIALGDIKDNKNISKEKISINDFLSTIQNEKCTTDDRQT
jgi:hypothetical protein